MTEEGCTPVRRTGRARKFNSRFANDELDDSFRKIAERINAPDSVSFALSSPPNKGKKSKKDKNDDGKALASPIVRVISPPDKPKIVAVRVVHVPKPEDLKNKAVSEAQTPSRALRKNKEETKLSKDKTNKKKRNSVEVNESPSVKEEKSKRRKTEIESDINDTVEDDNNIEKLTKNNRGKKRKSTIDNEAKVEPIHSEEDSQDVNNDSKPMQIKNVRRSARHSSLDSVDSDGSANLDLTKVKNDSTENNKSSQKKKSNRKSLNIPETKGTVDVKCNVYGSINKFSLKLEDVLAGEKYKKQNVNLDGTNITVLIDEGDDESGQIVENATFKLEKESSVETKNLLNEPISLNLSSNSTSPVKSTPKQEKSDSLVSEGSKNNIKKEIPEVDEPALVKSKKSSNNEKRNNLKISLKQETISDLENHSESHLSNSNFINKDIKVENTSEKNKMNFDKSKSEKVKSNSETDKSLKSSSKSIPKQIENTNSENNYQDSKNVKLIENPSKKSKIEGKDDKSKSKKDDKVDKKYEKPKAEIKDDFDGFPSKKLNNDRKNRDKSDEKKHKHHHHKDDKKKAQSHSSKSDTSSSCKQENKYQILQSLIDVDDPDDSSSSPEDKTADNKNSIKTKITDTKSSLSKESESHKPKDSKSKHSESKYKTDKSIDSKVNIKSEVKSSSKSHHKSENSSSLNDHKNDKRQDSKSSSEVSKSSRSHDSSKHSSKLIDSKKEIKNEIDVEITYSTALKNSNQLDIKPNLSSPKSEERSRKSRSDRRSPTRKGNDSKEEINLTPKEEFSKKDRTSYSTSTSEKSYKDKKDNDCSSSKSRSKDTTIKKDNVEKAVQLCSQNTSTECIKDNLNVVEKTEIMKHERKNSSLASSILEIARLGFSFGDTNEKIKSSNSDIDLTETHKYNTDKSSEKLTLSSEISNNSLSISDSMETDIETKFSPINDVKIKDISTEKSDHNETFENKENLEPEKVSAPIKTAEELQREAELKEKRSKEIVKQRLKSFVHLTENLYLIEKKKTKACKEVRRMVCDCFLSSEEISNGEVGCGEDCLNRMLMIEW